MLLHAVALSLLRAAGPACRAASSPLPPGRLLAGMRWRRVGPPRSGEQGLRGYEGLAHGLAGSEGAAEACAGRDVGESERKAEVE
jgi:hypothetical protein